MTSWILTLPHDFSAEDPLLATHFNLTTLLTRINRLHTKHQFRMATHGYELRVCSNQAKGYDQSGHHPPKSVVFRQGA